MIQLVQTAIDVQQVLESVLTPASGAVDVFVGTTRNHSNGRAVRELEYEAYEPMALKMMNQIAEQARQVGNIHAVSIVHRIGKVPIGESSVVIAVSASHRDDAFRVCRFLIDELKRIVPIWKREYFADGTTAWSLHSHEQLRQVES
jgi:molybdopterin synthase catalytic subunit